MKLNVVIIVKRKFVLSRFINIYQKAQSQITFIQDPKQNNHQTKYKWN